MNIREFQYINKILLEYPKIFLIYDLLGFISDYCI